MFFEQNKERKNIEKSVIFIENHLLSKENEWFIQHSCRTLLATVRAQNLIWAFMSLLDSFGTQTGIGWPTTAADRPFIAARGILLCSSSSFSCFVSDSSMSKSFNIRSSFVSTLLNVLRSVSSFGFLCDLTTISWIASSDLECLGGLGLGMLELCSTFESNSGKIQ